ncbi:hypothetical protein W97_04278 [Coniosporium apollinis CBS 100218]|uniref:Methyltransferase type 11 domain-containing protein n=1 Tax=Coniosporium apollinis (strain CBS 100218) TaxID=1168221 RepID=R7YT81_CONA1|nr:uncharacterized protein W97_04278 [Coniosporium apollinis CBS 100218]EON65043.1 hypothetical protein W97_04278 [Coniosporium apollinis CBS 100218]
MSSPRLDSRAQSGFSKSSLYDQHRPSYPANAVDMLLDAVRVAGIPGASIVDLGAGTGKFTELLAKRDERYDILAVEPHEQMRKELERKALDNVTVKDGLSTSIPVADETVDAVIAAQAFHWIANGDSLKEIHRVLVVDGALGMIWNVEDYNQTKSAAPSTAWEGKLKDLIWSLDDNQPRFRHEKWRAVFDEQLRSTPLTITAFANPLFSLPLGEHEEKWTVWLSKEAVWDRFNTLSQIAVLEGEERERVRQIFDDAVNSDDVETNEKGEIALHGVTVTAWTSKIP